MARILVTRLMAPLHPWRMALEASGHVVRGIPFADVEPVPFALPTQQYQAYIFNSPNAVRYFAQKETVPEGTIVVAPGRGTADALVRLGINVSLMADGTDMERFAAQVAERLHGLRVLVPCSAQTRGTLISGLDPSMVTQIAVYRTRTVRPDARPDARETVLFTSPLNVEGYLKAGWPRPESAIALGRTTAEALTEAGVLARECHTADTAGILAQLD